MNGKIESGKLLFIDEIQELKEMMELLRFLSEERKSWHIIVTGSLLEAKMVGKWSVPVGRVDYRYLFPLTFFEFLEAMGKGKLLADLLAIKMGETYPYHTAAKELFEQYVLLGGMPEVVEDFVIRNDYGRVKNILKRLQQGYLDDVGKYTRNEQEKRYLEAVVSNGTRVAGRVFRYEHFAGTDNKSREMSHAVSRVEKTMLCKQIPAINSIVLPTNIKMKRAKKMIWLDVGLVHLMNEHYGEMIQGDYSGGVMEQVVGQTLLSELTQDFVKLVYYAKDHDEGSAEVDFCFPYKGTLVAMEVKAGKSVVSKSLIGMLKEGEDRVTAVLVSFEELGIDRGIIKIPLYLLERWKELII